MTLISTAPRAQKLILDRDWGLKYESRSLKLLEENVKRMYFRPQGKEISLKKGTVTKIEINFITVELRISVHHKSQWIK